MRRIHGCLLRAFVTFFAVLPLTALAQPIHDIAVSISESADPVTAGSGAGNLTYVVTATNNGAAEATGLSVSVTPTLPAGVTLDSVTPSVGGWLAPVWTIGTLAGGTSVTLTFLLTVSPAAGYGPVGIGTHIASVEGTDPDDTNNTDTETTTIRTVATINVTKDFSDDSTAAVAVQLSCSFGGDQNTISEGSLWSVTAENFAAGATCQVTETVPAGYEVSYSADCNVDPILSSSTYSCLITNTQLPVQLVVNKTFTDGNDADVTIDLVCGAGTVTADDPTASGSDPAEFTISNLPAAGTTCTATETLPSRYGQESTTCTDVAVAVGGSPSCEFVNAPSQARIWVSKVFTDGNPGEIEVTLSCNTGLPLEQSFDISPGYPVAFVVTNYDDGELDCTVTEDGEAGYVGSYDDGTSVTDTACEFLDIAAIAELSCEITNTPAPVDLDITKEWVIEGHDSDVSTGYELVVYCDAEIVDGDISCLNGIPAGNTLSGEIVQISNGCKVLTGEGPNLHTVQVIPGYPSSSCWVDEILNDNAVEVDNGCGNLTVSAGEGAACTITNTVFFESVPTLSQLGKVLMVLLVLGTGLVAYRRIV